MIITPTCSRAQDKYVAASKTFLTESKLVEALSSVYGEHDVSTQKKFTFGKRWIRVDCCIESTRQVYEFQGGQHYTNRVNIYNDENRRKNLKAAGYEMVDVPYFIQLSPGVLEVLGLPSDIPVPQFPSGFISPRAELPAQFPEPGLHRFEQDLKRFPSEKESIRESLRSRAAILKVPVEIVCPEFDRLFD